jgi:quinol-cytochrome oxidoreductase complex cytochrome b subunit
MAVRELRASVNKGWQSVVSSSVWKSFFRHGWPDTTRNRMLVVLDNIFLHLHPTKIPRAALKVAYTWCAGGLSLFLFAVLSLTGVLLMFYYIPSIADAYRNMQQLETTVTLGMFFRNLHRWAAHGMVLMVFLHMFRVFYTGAYKPPREFNWVVGVGLLVLTLMLSFTGYLLPWDQLSYWAITVGTGMAGYAPGVGKLMRFLLIGGHEVTQNALIRWFTLHVIFLPGLAALLMATHFWRIRKDGGISRKL